MTIYAPRHTASPMLPDSHAEASFTPALSIQHFEAMNIPGQYSLCETL
jgi:hypothetical protein